MRSIIHTNIISLSVAKMRKRQQSEGTEAGCKSSKTTGHILESETYLVLVLYGYYSFAAVYLCERGMKVCDRSEVILREPSPCT